VAGNPGAYLVAFNKDPESLEARYCGVVYHPSEDSNSFAKCTEAGESRSPTPTSNPKGSSSTSPKDSEPKKPDPKKPITEQPASKKPKKGGGPLNQIVN
jgi:hypothetical protein